MVKVLEQYTTKLSLEEHQALQEAVKWLNENGFLKKTNKYGVTRYALKTLVDIVESKKKKATKEPEKNLKKEPVKEEIVQDKSSEKEEMVPKKESEKKEIVSEKESAKISVKETPNDLSNGGQGA